MLACVNIGVSLWMMTTDWGLAILPYCYKCPTYCMHTEKRYKRAMVQFLSPGRKCRILLAFERAQSQLPSCLYHMPYITVGS